MDLPYLSSIIEFLILKNIGIDTKITVIAYSKVKLQHFLMHRVLEICPPQSFFGRLCLNFWPILLKMVSKCSGAQAASNVGQP